MVLNFENIQHLFTLSLTLLFAFYIFLKRNNGRFGNVFIGLFVLNIGLESLDALLVYSSFYTNHKNLYLILPNFGLLIYPLFFFYIRAITYNGFKLKWLDIIHVLPYIIITIITLFEYHFTSPENQISIMTQGTEISWLIVVITYTLRLQGLVYLILTLRIVFRFKKIVKENYSNINKRNYKWILQLTFVFVYFILSSLIYNIVKFGFGEKYNEMTTYVLSSISFGFLVWIIYKGISQPYLFNGVDSSIKLLQEYLSESKTEHKKSIEDSSTDFDSKYKGLKIDLENYVKTHEVYLNHSLTIFELAEGLNMKSIELSIFLNKCLNKNFFEYINEYRVQKAMVILKDANKKHLTIQEIFYSVGFNSKSSFNTEFKKYTQTTPTQYRKKYLKISS